MLKLNLAVREADELLVLASAEPDWSQELTEFQKQSLVSGLEQILQQAWDIACKQLELSMPLGTFEILDLLRYTRQRTDHEVRPSHALNALTREFFDQLYSRGYRLTQFYVGEEQAVFHPYGPQRLRLHWYG